MTSSSSGDKLSPSFRQALEADPQARVSAIVRCKEWNNACQADLKSRGLTVRRRLRLIRGMAVEGRARELLQLAEAPWVLRIEPDQPVHTWRTRQ
ncbi:MAG: hypothetical protein GXP42_02515 [Chloroflexi bacterium]|nr:hypothetical protein [Chloroflexota bacterium]